MTEEEARSKFCPIVNGGNEECNGCDGKKIVRSNGIVGGHTSPPKYDPKMVGKIVECNWCNGTGVIKHPALKYLEECEMKSENDRKL